MKKLLLLSALLIFACSSDDSNNSNNTDDNSNNPDDNNNTPIVQLGDYVQGGIVFWINPDDPTNGMVISNEDGSSCDWGGCVSSGCSTYFGVGCFNDFGKGDIYTQRIVDAYDVEPFIGAGHFVDQYEHQGYNDWFLPSKLEFQRICYVRHTINNYVLENGGDILEGDYWSSSEYGDNRAVYWRFNESAAGSCWATHQYKFPVGYINPVPKWRGIRKFQL